LEALVVKDVASTLTMFLIHGDVLKASELVRATNDVAGRNRMLIIVIERNGTDTMVLFR